MMSLLPHSLEVPALAVCPGSRPPSQAGVPSLYAKLPGKTSVYFAQLGRSAPTRNAIALVEFEVALNR